MVSVDTATVPRMASAPTVRRAAALALAAGSILLTGCRVADPVATVPAAQALPLVAQRDVAYGAATGCPGTGSDATCGGSQTLDVYLPTAGGNRGVIVFVHGGGFTAGDKVDVTNLGNIVRQTSRGYGFVSVNYRLARNGTNLFPTQLQDVGAALRWVKANGASAGLNPAKVVLAGHSAGGTLASLTALGQNSGRPEFAGVPRVDGWVSVSGIMSPLAGPRSRFWFSQLVGETNFGQRAAAATPLVWLDANDPPGFLAHGDLDDVVEPHNLTATIQRAQVTNSITRLKMDLVDKDAAGRYFARDTRGHYPFAGLNAAEMDAWFDAR